jgi:hypothetical protein
MMMLKIKKKRRILNQFITRSTPDITEENFRNGKVENCCKIISNVYLCPSNQICQQVLKMLLIIS